MRLIEIVPAEKLVVIDGLTLQVEFSLDPNTKGVYWDASVPSGFVEKHEGKGEVLESFNDYQHIINAFQAKKEASQSTDFYFRIIADDKLVDVDGEARKIEALKINPNYHAVIWNGNSGFIETKNGRNIHLVNLTEFQDVLDQHAAILKKEDADRKAKAEEARKPTPAKLSAIRDAHLYGGLTIGGMSIGTDDLTQQRIMAAHIVAKEDQSYTVRWKLPGGFVTLDAPTIIAISDAIRAHVQACFEAEATVLIDLADYDTLEELEAAYATALES